jgi:hypothetical protein
MRGKTIAEVLPFSAKTETQEETPEEAPADPRAAEEPAE